MNHWSQLTLTRRARAAARDKLVLCGHTAPGNPR